ncbi:MAG: ice-binding family protein [Methylophilaceae bacterium]
MNRTPWNLALALVLPLACMSAPASAASLLGSAQNFAVLGGSTITNTNVTIIQGDLGVSPGSAYADVGSTTLTGTTHLSDSVALQAQTDALSAYNFLASQPFTTNLTGQDLGSLGSLLPGIYHFDSSAQLTGTLTLDAMNNPNALYIFQIGSTLTSASNSFVNVLNGSANIGIYFQVGSSATLGTGSTFAGNILADQSITLNTNTTIQSGRALALNGAVTMDSNLISNNCLASGCGTRNDFGSVGFSAGEVSAVPEPESYSLMLGGVGLLGLIVRRKEKRTSHKTE